ncbi:MAG: hypothetical protein OWT28_00160 [Firmicutes bacterium]|nr:hypothetical protein [Bacillota bacterium]
MKDIEIEIITPLISPALSPNKYMKQLMLKDLEKCYDSELKDLVIHLDRAFERTSTCDALISTSAITGALRTQYREYENIIVTGIITVPKNYIRIATKKAGVSLTNYEYIIPGTKIQTTLTFTQNVKLPLILRLGAKKNKGYGIVKLSQI